MTDILRKIRDMLLKELKEIKCNDYKSGYYDGCCDMYNETIKIMEEKK